MSKTKFTVTKNHLKLLRRMCVGWNDSEFGAPEINPKRPYGNSDVEQDMLEILGLKELKEGIYEFELDGEKWLLKGEDKYNIYLEGKDEEGLCEKLRSLHEEMEVVLQIILVTQCIEVGEYEQTDEYDSNSWKRV